VALHAGRRTALVVYLLGMAGLVAALVFQPAGIATAWSWISTLLTVTVAWLAGENLKARRARRRHELDEAHRQAELQAEEARRLIRQQAEEERRAISEERLRIARDLHDIVAHSMSVIAVQAGVAHHILDERPEVARDALGSIEVTARQGLVEMRRMLGVLRSEDDSTDHAPTTPAAGLRDIDHLISQFRSAGLQLEVIDLDHCADLPPALDISAYRIIQEGLTNVLRHGGPVAHLDVQRSPTQLRIEIRDDGRPQDSAPSTSGSGHGLTGIRERAALFDGTVRAEPVPGGGFRLTVELPIGPLVAAR
jgi:signal transduction histidine kinase